MLNISFSQKIFEFFVDVFTSVICANNLNVTLKISLYTVYKIFYCTCDFILLFQKFYYRITEIIINEGKYIYYLLPLCVCGVIERRTQTSLCMISSGFLVVNLLCGKDFLINFPLTQHLQTSLELLSNLISKPVTSFLQMSSWIATGSRCPKHQCHLYNGHEILTILVPSCLEKTWNLKRPSLFKSAFIISYNELSLFF